MSGSWFYGVLLIPWNPNIYAGACLFLIFYRDPARPGRDGAEMPLHNLYFYYNGSYPNFLGDGPKALKPKGLGAFLFLAGEAGRLAVPGTVSM